MTHTATKIPLKRADADGIKLSSVNFIANHMERGGPDFTPRRFTNAARATAADTMTCDASCALCPAFNLLYGGTREVVDGHENESSSDFPIASTLHTIPARRLILHPKEWSDYVPIICSGWAMSSIALPDGRRQIISFLLPGDVVSAGSLLAPLSGHAVEAVTDVTYRKFKRDEIKGLLFRRIDLLEKLFSLWSEANQRADQLALDLGRRRAEERIARLVLRLADKLAERSTERAPSFYFPLRQRHIADATGLTPVHVSKVMGEMQRAGLVAINSRSLTITNVAELKRVADWR